MLVERILITVRTYPTLSQDFMETVCTGGITEAGEWRRLYPVPLRYLDKNKQYKTFDVIEVPVSPGTDGRLETRRPDNANLRVLPPIKSWKARCEWVDPTILPSLQLLKSQGKTLSPVAVQEVLEFKATYTSAEWSKAEIERLRQANLFETRQPLEKIPYQFRFRWRDEGGEEHKSLIVAWELLETWRQYRHRYDNPIQVMRDKWLGDLCAPNRRVAFFMGNIAQRRNVFMVCGVFSPPKEVSNSGALWTPTGSTEK